MITLGIETSCDETSVALLSDTTILANEIYTQEIHSKFGGVVPEMASRAHVQKIEPLCAKVFADAGISLSAVDLIAVTDSPGLAGALLVGVGFALGLHTQTGIPVTGVNHLEGHIFSAILEYPDLKPPFIALVVSGGHTSLYVVKAFGEYELLGKTVDDAAGEAFDKVGKLLGFAYPAGRSIEQSAACAQENRGSKQLTFPIARVQDGEFDFSFSGLKTAVRNHINKLSPEAREEQKSAICYAFQEAAVHALVQNALAASRKTGIDTIAVVGGVACNGRLRKVFADEFGTQALFPKPRLCTDNAAMIACAGYASFKRNALRTPKMNPIGQI